MRRRGEFDIRSLDRDFPFQVAVEEFWGPDLYLALKWFKSAAPRTTTMTFRDRSYHVVCFTDEAEARLFRHRTRGIWIEGGHSGYERLQRMVAS